MTLDNRDELAGVLEDADRLGAVFARHAYGMRAWVDLFSVRIPDAERIDDKVVIAQVVADNARHAALFAQRARAHGVDPDTYRPPPEGHAIYERIEELHGLPALAGYAIGSLEHFRTLLEVYRAAARDPADAAALDGVIADTDRSLAALRPLAGRDRAGDGRAGDAAADAHELYRLRELAETPLYADVGT
jgi:hypothetical protein